MIIRPATEDAAAWNAFVEAEYPPVGAFMETWEWGEFQKLLGRQTNRYFVFDGKETIAAFTLVRFALPGGLSYGYVPRGPVVRDGEQNPRRVQAVIDAIRTWVTNTMPDLIFVRLEPPVASLELPAAQKRLCIPPYYIQPRRNLVVTLPKNEEEIIMSFHPSTRSNVRRAEKRGVTSVRKSELSQTDRAAFAGMIAETVKRNGGVNAYPSAYYFDKLFEAVPLLEDTRSTNGLSMAAFCGYQHGEFVSMHLVLFFGKTATYLYGATRTNHLNSKVDTYLHWAAMCEAQRRGYAYYDLGGVDENRWPSLTTFKRQFSKNEMRYMGNIDILIKPRWYKTYELMRKFKK